MNVTVPIGAKGTTLNVTVPIGGKGTTLNVTVPLREIETSLNVIVPFRQIVRPSGYGVGLRIQASWVLFPARVTAKPIGVTGP